MNKGIYIFKDETDFLNVIADLQKEYNNNKPATVEIFKKLENYTQLYKEIDFLKKCTINSVAGFRTAKQIKISATDGLNCKYCITYNFNNCKGNNIIYDKLNRYVRKRQDIYI